MKKDKVNYKLLNILLIISIVCLLFLIKDVWVEIVKKILTIIWPFIVAFAIAYALYPYKKKLEDKGMPSWLSTLIVILCSIGLIIVLLIVVGPLIYEQGLLFLSSISTFISDIGLKYEVNLKVIQETIANISSDIIRNLGKYISSGAITIITASFSVIATLVVIIFVSIYLLIDMEEIRSNIKKHIKKKKLYNYIKKLDYEVSNYFIGFFKNMLIQFIEYTTIFCIIGHPNFLILGILASVSNIIPYFGGFIVNILALIISSVISRELTILTLIVCLICPQLDTYIIAPKIYGKTNNIHPIINIFAVFAGGILLGFWGILIALPVAIIVITTYKYFKNDIDKKIYNIKNNK